MNHLIVGYGEIGKAVKGIINEQSVDIIDEGYTVPGPNRHFDIMHVCFPYDDNFTQAVCDYYDKYIPDYVVIYSTVAIGTTDLIANYVGNVVAHSPVEGKHPDLELSMRTMPRWVGVQTKELGQYLTGFYEEKGLRVHIASDPKFTEFLKLRSTSKYGINLMWADYEESVAADIGMDFKLINEFDADYNKLYQEMGLPQFQRYLVTPPSGGLGGHCLIENAVILDEQYPGDMLKRLLSLGKNINTIQEEKPYLNRAWLYGEYWGKGRSSEDIAREFGCTGANILRVMKKLNIVRRNRTWTSGEIDDLRSLVETHTYKEIAEKIGKTHDAVRLKGLQLGLESCYDPSQPSEETRKKISATLQGVTLEEWENFTSSANEVIRRSEEYREWRREVFTRDNYTCVHCGLKSGQGESVILHADHIKPFATHEELRFDVDNGRTLCIDCHKKTDTYGGKTRRAQ